MKANRSVGEMNVVRKTSSVDVYDLIKLSMQMQLTLVARAILIEA